MTFREAPWQLCAHTLRESGELLCYSGGETGPFTWQKGSEISSGEFRRPGGWETPIHLASFYPTASHVCFSEAEAKDKTIERAGFRKPFFIAEEGGWIELNRRMARGLEAYDGLDPFLLSMRSRVQFYGGLSDGQTKSLRRMLWKLKKYLPND